MGWESPPQELLDRRSEPDCRAVLDDWHYDRDRKPPLRLGVALWLAAADAAAAAAAAAADADAADAADAAAAAAAAAVAAADAAAAAADAAADADAAAADAADAARSLETFRKITLEPDMREGLKLVQLPGGYYGRSVTRVGWLKRVSGDEFVLLNSISIWRKSGDFAQDGLERLAAEGPSKDYAVTKPAKSAEEIHRLVFRRALVADESKWAEACPQPKNWAASE